MCQTSKMSWMHGIEASGVQAGKPGRRPNRTGSSASVRNTSFWFDLRQLTDVSCCNLHQHLLCNRHQALHYVPWTIPGAAAQSASPSCGCSNRPAKESDEDDGADPPGRTARVPHPPAHRTGRGPLPPHSPPAVARGECRSCYFPEPETPAWQACAQSVHLHARPRPRGSGFPVASHRGRAGCRHRPRPRYRGAFSLTMIPSLTGSRRPRGFPGREVRAGRAGAEP